MIDLTRIMVSLRNEGLPNVNAGDAVAHIASAAPN